MRNSRIIAAKLWVRLVLLELAIMPSCGLGFAGAERDRLERSCNAGDFESCVALGGLYRDGKDGPQDEKRARELFEQICSVGYPMGCNRLGRMLDDGRGGPADHGRARDLFELACGKGIAAACNNLGAMYDGGRSVPGKMRARNASTSMRVMVATFMDAETWA